MESIDYSFLLLQNPSPYSPDRAERLMDKGIEKF
jgi:hypothetical protein